MEESRMMELASEYIDGHRESTAEEEMRNACGVPVVCAMGVQGANNHSMEEFAVAEPLFSRTKLALASIITL